MQTFYCKNWSSLGVDYWTKSFMPSVSLPTLCSTPSLWGLAMWPALANEMFAEMKQEAPRDVLMWLYFPSCVTTITIRRASPGNGHPSAGPWTIDVNSAQSRASQWSPDQISQSIVNLQICFKSLRFGIICYGSKSWLIHPLPLLSLHFYSVKVIVFNSSQTLSLLVHVYFCVCSYLCDWTMTFLKADTGSYLLLPFPLRTVLENTVEWEDRFWHV